MMAAIKAAFEARVIGFKSGCVDGLSDLSLLFGRIDFLEGLASSSSRSGTKPPQASFGAAFA